MPAIAKVTKEMIIDAAFEIAKLSSKYERPMLEVGMRHTIIQAFPFLNGLQRKILIL